MTQPGQILEVSITPMGDELELDHAIGETTLDVGDVADFSEEGGQLVINGIVYTYLSCDDEAATIQLFTGLTEAAPMDTPVYVYPLSEEKTAMVEIDDREEAILAKVPHSLYDRLPDGVRDEQEQEVVTVELVDGDWMIRNIEEQVPSVDGGYLDPETVPPDPSAVHSYVTEYAVGPNETDIPLTGWSTDTPERTPGTYVWYRTTVTYGNGTTATTSPALLTGNDGAPGSPGIPGEPGADGQTLYTWLKYADTPTTGMSDSPTGKTYMGIAYNKTSPVESSTYGDYAWSLIQGPQGNQGVQGPPGADGQPTYTWVKYGDSAAGAGLSDSPTGKSYIGLAFNKVSPTESTVPGDYTWSLIQGPQGPQGSQGIQGPPGADGTPRYMWLKYADTPTTGMSDSPTGKTYMGVAYNKTTATESSTYSDYEWSLIQGPQGNQGIQGPAGANGQTTYTWVKYATNATGTAGFSDSPTGATYIGLAFNKTTATESSTPSDYTWSLIQGPQGNAGAAGVSVTAITPYFAQVSAVAAAPAKPTTATPPSPWQLTEPAYAVGTALYRTEKVSFSNGTFSYTDVVKSSAYAAVTVPPPVVPQFDLTGMPRGVMLQVTNGQPGWTYAVRVTDRTTEDTADIVQTYADSNRPIMYFENMPDGTPFSATSQGYSFQVTASNGAGSAVSPESETQKLVLNDSNTIAELAVGKLKAGDLIGAFALLGALNVGTNIEITPEDGIVVHTPLGDTKLPADGQNPQFTGSATFDALTILGDLGLQGRTNEITKGSRLELATGTTAPKSSPVMTSYWPEKPIHDGFNPRGFAKHTATGYYYTTESAASGAVTATTEDADSFDFAFRQVQVTSGTDSGGGGAWGRSEVTAALGGVAILGNQMFVLCQTSEAIPGTFYGRWYIYKGSYNTTSGKWEFVKRWLYEPTDSLGGNSTDYPAIGIDEINSRVLVAQCGSGAGTVNLTRYDLDGTYITRTTPNNADGSNYNPGKGVRSVQITNGDFGSARLMLLMEGETTWKVFSYSTENYISAESFPVPTSAIVGAFWDSSKGIFRSRAATKAYDHTNILSTTLAAVKTWRKSDAVAPDYALYETDKSPAAITTTFPKRAAVLLTSSAIPDDITDPNDPNALTYYVAQNDLSGTNTSYKRQTPLATGTSPTLNVTDQRLTSINAAGGNPPTSPNFPAATPASITSDAADGGGELIRLLGSGAWRLGDISGDAAGRVVGGAFVPIGGAIPFFGAAPPTGWLLANGGTFSESAYPLLAAFAAANGWQLSSGVAPNRVFFLPDTRDRFISGAGTTRPAGTSGGSDTVTMPDHNHYKGDLDTDIYSHNRATNTSTSGSGIRIWDGNGNHKHAITGQTGVVVSNPAISNVPKYLAANYIVRAA